MFVNEISRFSWRAKHFGSLVYNLSFNIPTESGFFYSDRFHNDQYVPNSFSHLIAQPVFVSENLPAYRILTSFVFYGFHCSC